MPDAAAPLLILAPRPPDARLCWQRILRQLLRDAFTFGTHSAFLPLGGK